MNYLREINAFYDWLETNPLTDSAIALWFALMHISNKAGWQPEFAVANQTLSSKTGLKKDAILRARLRLQQSGRIDFKSRTGQLSAIYSIIPFDSADCVGISDTNRAQTAHNPSTNRAQSASINKLNSLSGGGDGGSELIDLNFAKAVKAVDAQFPARINPIQSEELAKYIGEGMDPEIVVRAVKMTRLAGKDIRFLWGILKICSERGIFTVDAFEADQAQRASGGNDFKPASPVSTRGSSRASYYAQKAREAAEHEDR